VSHPEHEPQNPWTGGQGPEPAGPPAQPGFGYGQGSTGQAGSGQGPNGYAYEPKGYPYEPNGYAYGHPGAPADPAPYGDPSGQPYGQQPYGQAYGQQPYGQVGYGYGPATTGSAGTPTLDQPSYGIGFVGAIQRAFAKYARFDGRASRSEYWWWTLATVLVFGVLGGIVGASTEAAGSASPSPIVVLLTIVLVLALLAVIVPSVAVTVRRLHDADLSGWLYLLTFIPYVGGLVLLVLTALPSKPAGARFDRSPVQSGYPR
jgi:uncharacterized membrane protein YhaH (DUF805 family)